ncbi:MAG TPA: sulfatase-like hydrolase/transferase, partial [Puia sp.]|nr:sulfatase-like hydrolase/transferase [Puia sp.]
MKRIIRLLLPALLFFVTGYSQQKPNIIFILADDLGYGDLGSYGQKMIRTPHIDSLASQGMRFTNYYAGCSVCAPSRETLMTGKHTGHTYIRGNFLTDSKEDPPMPDSKMTVAEFLKGAGYNTALIGKWGLGGELHGPEKQGFDYTYGYLDQIHAHDYYPTYLYENGKKFAIDENKDSARKVLSEDLFIGKTLDYLGKVDAKKPFFLYLPYTFPHGEYNLPPDTPYSAANWPRQFKVYATMVTRLDGYVAEIMKMLKEKGVADNTLVVLASDNGANMGFAKFFNSNGPLSGSKFGLYEGGIRVPMIANWPGKIRPGAVSDLITASWDMLPTICNVAGLPAPKDIDGISILPELTGAGQTARHDYLYWEYYNYNYNWYKPGETLPRNWLESVALRMGKWKAMKKDMYKDKHAPVELYDLETDPGEKSNVAAQHPDLVSKAAALFVSNTEVNTPWFPYQPKFAAWRGRLLHYVNTDMGKSDGGFGWPDQYDSHLEPSFAAVGILRAIDALPEDREPLISYIRNHHPQRQQNKETGPSGFVPRTLLYEQIRSLEWLGADLSGFKKEVEAERSDTRNLYNYEDHGYGVFDQEVLTLVNDHLLATGRREGYPGLTDYILERRRSNGSFNNAPARFGGDGNILNTYWGLYAMQILGKTNEKKQETRKWLQACQLKNGGFTHQPSPVIGGNDDVAYTWAAVKALDILSARPARLNDCIKYLISLLNTDGGFGNRPGLPSTPMSTYYALDALKTLNAVAQLDKVDPFAGRETDGRAAGDAAGLTPTPAAAKATDLSGYKVFTVQIQA